MTLVARIENEFIAELADHPSANWAVNNIGGVWLGVWDDDVAIVEVGWGHEPGHSVRYAPQWVQPTGSTDAYPADAWVYHNGRLWRSLVDDNVWEPGVANWRTGDVNGLDLWIQPTGAQDAYGLGVVVRYPDEQGERYESLIDANTTEPGVDPLDRWWEPLDREPADGDWVVGGIYAVDDQVEYDGALYRCLQAHTAIAGWEPPNVPALWGAIVTTTTAEWTIGVTYEVGDEVIWMGSVYRALRRHTSRTNKDPSDTNLWELVG